MAFSICVLDPHLATYVIFRKGQLKSYGFCLQELVGSLEEKEVKRPKSNELFQMCV